LDSSENPQHTIKIRQ